MLKVSFIALVVSIVIFSGCDNYSHNSYVNTNPANYLNLNLLKFFGGPDNDIGYSILSTNDNGYVIVGSTQSFGNALNPEHSSLYFLKLDSTGNLETQQFHGGWGDDFGVDIKTAQDNNVIICGTTSSYDITTGNKIDITEINPDIFQYTEYNIYLMLTDIYGNVIWEKPIGTVNYPEWGKSVVKVDDGFIVLGYQDKGENDKDFFVVKTDFDGNIIWQKTMGTPNIDIPYSIVSTADGGYIIGGYTTTFHSIISNPYILKLDNSGEIIWENIYSPIGSDVRIYSLIQTENGDFVATGASNIYTDSEITGASLYVMKINLEGGLIWDNTYPLSNVESGRSIIENLDGSLVLCGENLSSSNIAVTKLDSDGIMLWSQISIVIGVGMQISTGHEGYIITGYTNNILANNANDVLLIEILEDLTNIEI